METLCRTRYITNYRRQFGSLFSLTTRADVWGLLKKLDTKRALNILRVLYEWKNGIAVTKSRPFVIALESSALCNLKCPPCSTTIRAHNGEQPKVKMMSLDTFQKILTATKLNAYIIKFHLDGEPTVNPNIFEMVRLASQHKIYTSFSTNFNLMRKELLGPLVRSGLSWISICLDGFSQGPYEKYRVGGNVETVKDGISMLMDYKHQNGVKNPFVNVSTIRFKHVEGEIRQILRFCSDKKVDLLTFKPDEKNFDGSHCVDYGKKAYRRCFSPWMWPAIDVDGSIFPCSASFYWGFRKPFGIVAEQDFDEIWNNTQFTECREFLSGREKARSKVELPCYTCPGFR